MARAMNFIYLFLMSVRLTLVYTQDVCVQKSPCVCEFPNGTGIDLSPIEKSTFYSTQTFQLTNLGSKLALNTFFYHPCHDLLLPENTTAANTTTCQYPLSLCLYVRFMEKQNGTTDTFKIYNSNYEYLGNSSQSTFSPDGKSITYANLPSTTVVNLICVETEDKFQIFSLEEPDKIELAFYSKNACLKQIEEPGRSLGSTLLIILFSLVILYLVLGICTKKFLMGATGIEVIPNLAFWSDLPNLVRDGWAFAINGFKLPARGAGPVTSPDPNSYDSI